MFEPSSHHDFNRNATICWLVGAVCLTAILISTIVTCTAITERHTTEMFRACVSSAGSWIDGECRR